MHILAVSGSLRAVSKNTAILEAARLLAPPRVEITLYTGLDTLPHFNPDLDTADGRGGPDTVADWRGRIARADGWIFRGSRSPCSVRRHCRCTPRRSSLRS